MQRTYQPHIPTTTRGFSFPSPGLWHPCYRKEALQWKAMQLSRLSLKPRVWCPGGVCNSSASGLVLSTTPEPCASVVRIETVKLTSLRIASILCRCAGVGLSFIAQAGMQSVHDEMRCNLHHVESNFTMSDAKQKHASHSLSQRVLIGPKE